MTPAAGSFVPPMTQVAVTALKAFEYEGRAVVKGDVFEVPAIDAAILRYQHKVICAGTPKPPDAPKRRRTYRRRDLVAESSDE